MNQAPNSSPEEKTSGTPLPFHMKTVRIALAGNPNCGKTTAFNEYTGTRQHVGNYPGVTVDRKEGTVSLDGENVVLVDLPGTYSLTPYSQEEIVVRAVLASASTEERPLAVIDIVEASALERSLFLTVQIMEMGMPVVLACNMMDEAKQAGIHVDTELLAARLNIPVVPTVARNGSGLKEALREALRVGHGAGHEALHISYGPDLDPVLKEMEARIAAANLLADRYTARWIAIKLLENDEVILKEAREADSQLTDSLMADRTRVAEHLRDTLNATPESIIADYRYGYIRGALRSGVITHESDKSRLALSDKLDKVFTNPLLGPLIMLALMFLIFQVTFEVGAYPQGWVEDAFDWLGEACGEAIPEGFLQSMVVDGIISGVGGVLSFVPLIMIMFLFIAFLEDSGYMARIAYMLDRIFRMFGLHGASVMPYVIGGGIAGGCAIPGVMATRTLRSPKEKLATLLTLPYMVCGAKLPVFLLLVGVFFPENPGATMFSLTLLGWIFALIVAKLLRSTIIKGEATPFVMELPPYRMPTIRSVCTHCWERTWMYLKKAGTVLVAISILIWASMTFPALDPDLADPFEANIAQLEEKLAAAPADSEEAAGIEEELNEVKAALASEELRHSYAGRMGTALEPFTASVGFDWRTDIALISGIAAKEAVLATLGTAYSLGEVDPEEATDLANQLAQNPDWNKATAFALMIFVLLYSPCFVALIIIRQEAGSWGWLLFSMVFNTALAYAVAVLAHRIGTALWT